MKHIALLLSLLLLCGAASAQAPAFDQATVAAGNIFGGVGSDLYGGRSAPDSQGNTYEAGYYSGTATFGAFVLGPVSDREIFVARRNAAGVYQWAVRASSSATMRLDAFQVDASGGMVLAGSFDGGTASFGPYALTNAHAGIPNAYSRPDVFVAKISSAGTWQWAVRAGGGTQTGAFDLVTDLQLDGAGNAYVSGTFNGPTAQFGTTVLTNLGQGLNADRTDVFVAKLNAAGAWQWAVQGGGPGNDGNPFLAFTAQGDLLVTGYMYNITATFGTVSISNPTGGAFVAKLSSAGAWQWATSNNGNDPCGNTNIGTRAVVDGSGNIYVMGSFNSRIANFGTTTLTNAIGPQPTSSCSAPSDMFVAKLDANGSWQWAVRGGGEGSDGNAAVAVDAVGNVYMTGYFGGYAPSQFGTTALYNVSALYYNSNGNGFKYPDIYVAKVNAAGVFQWAVSAGGNGSDYPGGIAIDAAGCLTITGNFGRPGASFGSLTLVSATGSNLLTPFSARLGCRPLATAVAAPPVAFTLHPNPSPRGTATLSWQLPTGVRASAAVVHSVLGQAVRAVALPAAATGTTELRGLAPGMYLVRLLGAEGNALGAPQRLVVE
jgi:hypothetical protein